MASSELLKQIQAGKRLKHAEINDRSAPQVDTPKSSGGSKGSGGSRSSAPLASGGGPSGGPPQPGNLFAGGIPKLKPAGQSKLGKPPSIPKSDGSLAPTPPARYVPTPPAPAPARPVPPRKYDISSSAPLPPRRAPPVIRSESPPAAPPRPRTQSPVSPASTISRSSAAVPIRIPVTSPTKPKVVTPERAPPPPPKSSHVVAPSPVRTAPTPPGRKPPSAAIAAAYTDSAARTYPPEPDSSSVPPRAIPHLLPPSRRLPLASTNGDRLLARRKIVPSPPPNAGVHTFPVTGFPPPRDFKNINKIYKSGSQRGSNFNLSNL